MIAQCGLIRKPRKAHGEIGFFVLAEKYKELSPVFWDALKSAVHAAIPREWQQTEQCNGCEDENSLGLDNFCWVRRLKGRVQVIMVRKWRVGLVFISCTFVTSCPISSVLSSLWKHSCQVNLVPIFRQILVGVDYNDILSELIFWQDDRRIILVTASYPRILFLW